MKKILHIYIAFAFCISLYSQSGFEFSINRNKITIPVKVINNLVIIPLEINGVPMNFLLDTGVKETVLFSLDETKEIEFSAIEKIQIRGFGKKDPFDGFKTSNNTIKTKDYIDKSHIVYLVLDEDINISSQLGYPVNGIIGYYFFKNNPIKIDYDAQKVIVYKDEKSLKKSIKKYEKAPLTFHFGKPFVTVETVFKKDKAPLNTKLLLDTGNSDALWYFINKDKSIELPSHHINDFLGKSVTGEVYGERGRIQSISWMNSVLKEPIASFPDTLGVNQINFTEDRHGSIGSEILRRYTLIFDYKNEMLYSKKNSFFNDPFHFNMSGIEVQHQGLEWVKTSYEENPAIANNLFDINGDKIAGNLKYKFELKPVFVIATVRKNSPAEEAGLQKNDVIVKINKEKCYNYTLQQITDILKSEEGRTIKIEIDRNGKHIETQFKLKSLL